MILEKNDCKLSSIEKNKYYDYINKKWILTDSIINSLNSDIQIIVDCTEENDTIIFNTNNIIKPKNTININWHLTITSLLISPSTSPPPVAATVRQQPPPQSNNKKAIFTCHRDNAIFNIKSKSVTLSNIIISDCHMMARRKKSKSPPYDTIIKKSEEERGIIIFSNKCESSNNYGIIEFKNVEFKRNINTRCFSFKRKICSSLHMTHVLFENNTSPLNNVIGKLPPLTTISDTSFINNKIKFHNQSVKNKGIMMYNNGILAIQRIYVKNNIGTLFSIENGNISISDSMFQNNMNVHLNFSSSVLLMPSVLASNKANVKIDNSTFSKTKSMFIYLKDSDLIVNNSTFEYCNATVNVNGNYSAIVSEDSKLNIKNSKFSNNISNRSGGVLSIQQSDVSISKTSFYNNSASNGGAISIQCFKHQCHVNIENSDFTLNHCEYGGGALYLESFVNATIKHCYFTQNYLSLYWYGEAGVIYMTSHGWNDSSSSFMELKDIIIKNNNFINEFEKMPSMILNIDQCHFYNNSFRNGKISGIKANNGTLLSIQNTLFSDNVVYAGPLIYVKASYLFCFNCTFKNNHADSKPSAIFTEGYNQVFISI